ncbi:hypothetical protein [Lacipirellula limnantheis]|uniref:hypothetical protein n=1 Tax=Lacipirellula limnantheis TaxID=2528024 RepID=UPI0011A4DB34|nr:hypothetical protein [Lacipirellula limnantheis]
MPGRPTDDGWFVDSFRLGETGCSNLQQHIVGQQGQFGSPANGVYFPLWYPALIFALAGIAALRLGRRSTLRSAIIATTIVTGLLGMAVIL